MRLTDLTIKSLPRPGCGARIYTDDLVPGFGVRISQGGTKSFVLTHGPRHERETIGRVGIVALQEARAEAKRRLAEYTLGKQKPFRISWNAAKEEFLAEKALKLKPRTLFDYTYILNRDFRFGITPMDELTPRELHRSLDRLHRTPVHQEHAFGVLRAFIRWAHRRYYVDRNPMERMDAPPKHTPRDRVLSSKELKAVWNAAGDGTFGRIVKLLILTGQRKGEITQLSVSMIRDNRITLPATLTKNKREHSFPLGTLAMKHIQPLPASNAYLFPAVGRTTPFNGHSACKVKLDKKSGTSNWTLHDLRRTFASGLASLGVALPVIERLLNHVSGSFGGIVGVYQRYDFFPEMRDAITKWEDHILQHTKT